MSNDYYNHGGFPATGSAGASSTARAEFDAIMAGFAKLPVLAASALQLVRVNAGATGLESTNSIDGIVIGGTTPAAGSFTTLSATGDVSLGNAVADTISVGGVTVKGSAGNWALPSPSSGVTLTVNTAIASESALFNGTNGAFGGAIRIQNTGANILSLGSALGLLGGALADAAVTAATGQNLFLGHANGAKVTIAGAGNVTIAAPSSGLTLAALTNGAPAVSIGANAPAFGTLNIERFASTPLTTVTIGDSATPTNQVGVYLRQTSGVAAISTAGAGVAMYRDLGVTTVFSYNSTGNVVISAPSSGDAITASTSGAGGGIVFAGSSGNEAGGNLFQLINANSALVQTFIAHSGAQTNIGNARTDGGGVLALYSANLPRITLGAVGNVTIAAPSSGVGLTISGGGLAVTGASVLTGAVSGVTTLAIGGALTGATTGAFSAGLTCTTLGMSGALTGATTGAFSGAVGTGALTVTGSALTPTSSQAFTATPTFNASLSNVFEFSGVMTANVTSVTITNPTAGQTIQIRVEQDGTGGRTVAAPSGAKIAGSVSLTANAASILTLTYSAKSTRWEGSWLQTPA